MHYGPITHRVMVEGEDGMLMCYRSGITSGYAIDVAIEEAAEDYPCASIWVEKE